MRNITETPVLSDVPAQESEHHVSKRFMAAMVAGAVLLGGGAAELSPAVRQATVAAEQGVENAVQDGMQQARIKLAEMFGAPLFDRNS